MIYNDIYDYDGGKQAKKGRFVFQKKFCGVGAEKNGIVLSGLRGEEGEARSTALWADAPSETRATRGATDCITTLSERTLRVRITARSARASVFVLEMSASLVK